MQADQLTAVPVVLPLGPCSSRVMLPLEPCSANGTAIGHLPNNSIVHLPSNFWRCLDNVSTKYSVPDMQRSKEELQALPEVFSVP